MTIQESRETVRQKLLLLYAKVNEKRKSKKSERSENTKWGMNEIKKGKKRKVTEMWIRKWGMNEKMEEKRKNDK